MRKLTIALMAGAGALFVGSANASDTYTGSEYTNSDLCSQFGWSVMTAVDAVAGAAAA